MALGSALVDRARALSNTAGARVEGRTVTSESPGAWFRCRYLQDGASEVGDFAGHVVTRPTLLCGTRDRARGAIALNAGQRVEVECKALWPGTRIFEVDGDPEPLRKRRRLLGFEAKLARVAEHGPVT